MSEEADYPARTVFFYGVSGETLRVANLISDAANPPACMEFGGTFFNVKNFAKLLHHQPKVTSTLLRFQGHWRLPPVHDVQEYANDLNDWHLSNYNVMMGAYNEQKQLADYNWLRLSGSLCYFMTSRTMPEISPVFNLPKLIWHNQTFRSPGETRGRILPCWSCCLSLFLPALSARNYYIIMLKCVSLGSGGLHTTSSQPTISNLLLTLAFPIDSTSKCRISLLLPAWIPSSVIDLIQSLLMSNG